ncbi:MAG: glycosyltransferase [Nitrospirae bacterium]|nr:glycosyltransferase [Nitrospirota bacterium]
MRLAINASYSGVKTAALEAFTREVVQRLCRIDETTLVFSPVAIPGIDESNIVLTSEPPAAPAVSYFSNLMFNNTILPYQLAWHKADVLFCPATEFPFIDILPMSVMIHDLDPLFYPERFGLEGEYFKTALGHLHRQDIRALVTTNYLKEQLLNNTGVYLSNIDIVRLGLDISEYKPVEDELRRQLKKDFAARMAIPAPYILFFVDPDAPDGACDTVIAAFNDIKSRIRHSLLIVGKDKEPSNKIQYLGSVAVSDMPLLFTYADLLIESSDSVHILKAGACGTPVIVSNIEPLPELVSDAGMLFNPSDFVFLSKLILMAIMNRNLRKEMIDNGVRFAHRFSWENTAEDIYASCSAAYAESYDRRRKSITH